jgi:carboxymethylenebutenolidase
VAPELFVRQGDVSQLKEVKEIIEKVVSKVPDSQVMDDLDATASWAAKNGGNADKMAITGFCWGGRITWMYAAHNPRLKAGVAWYGGLVRPATPMTPRHPIDVSARLKVPVLGLYGAADAGIPNETVEQMRDALKKAGSASEIINYIDTPHAFFADYRPSYRPGEANDGWKRLLVWLRKNGVA